MGHMFTFIEALLSYHGASSMPSQTLENGSVLWNQKSLFKLPALTLHLLTIWPEYFLVVDNLSINMPTSQN